MKSEMIELESDAGKFPVYVAHPENVPKGGVIVIHEVWGLAPHIKDVAERFASEGYVAVAPDLLSDSGITYELVGHLAEELFDPERRNQAQPKLRELMAPMQAPDFGRKTTQRVQNCFDFASKLPGVEGRVAIVGFCFGGTYSFSLAVSEPTLKAAVPFYGHADFSVSDLKRIHCPIMAFYGEQDERLVGSLDQLKSDMNSAHVDFQAKVYSGCGHAFFNDSNRFAYNSNAAHDAWARTLDFLEANLT